MMLDLTKLDPVVAAAFITAAVSIFTGGVVAIVSAIMGPLLVARAARKASSREFQRAIANRLLEVWMDPSAEDVPTLLRGPQGAHVKRVVFVLGQQLRDSGARNACGALVRAIDDGSPDEELIDAWWQVVRLTSRVVYA